MDALRAACGIVVHGGRLNESVVDENDEGVTCTFLVALDVMDSVCSGGWMVITLARSLG